METREGYITSIITCPRCGGKEYPEGLTREQVERHLKNGYCFHCEVKDIILKEIEEHHEGYRQTLGYDIKEMVQTFINIFKAIFNIVFKRKP